ncbi:Uncharacterised protein [Bordetella pertussis]|nr:Uncharacterised protein [Bordetella pertussis]
MLRPAPPYSTGSVRPSQPCRASARLNSASCPIQERARRSAGISRSASSRKARTAGRRASSCAGMAASCSASMIVPKMAPIRAAARHRARAPVLEDAVKPMARAAARASRQSTRSPYHGLILDVDRAIHRAYRQPGASLEARRGATPAQAIVGPVRNAQFPSGGRAASYGATAPFHRDQETGTGTGRTAVRAAARGPATHAGGRGGIALCARHAVLRR